MAEYLAPSVTRRRLIVGAAAALGAGPLLLTGCGRSKSNATGSKLDQVTYLTGLGLTGKESYALVAQALGYFAAEGLEVKIQAGAAGDSNLNLLAAGKAEFSAIDYAGAVVRAGKGTLGGVRAISVSYSKTMSAVMTLASSGISQPRNLIGKKLAGVTGAVPRTMFPSYAQLAGLSPKEINSVSWQKTDAAGLIPALTAGNVDGIGFFVSNVPNVQAAAKGATINVLPYSHYLNDLYGDIIVARPGLDQDLCVRFVRAVWKGLQYAIGHPDEAGNILHTAVPTALPTVAAAGLRLLTSYVTSPLADPSLVARSFSLIQRTGQIPSANIDPSSVVDFSVGNALGKL